MTSAVGGHGSWREIGTPRSAGAFLPAGRGAAETHGSSMITGLGPKGKKFDSFFLLSMEEGVTECGFFGLMMAYL